MIIIKDANTTSEVKWAPAMILLIPNVIAQLIIIAFRTNLFLIDLSVIKTNNDNNIHPIALCPEGNESLPVMPCGKYHGLKFE